jgi:hypothetical protein
MLLVPGSFALRLLILLHRFLLMLGLSPVVFLLLLHGALCFALVFADGSVFFAGVGGQRAGKSKHDEQRKGNNAFHNGSGWHDLNIGTRQVGNLEDDGFGNAATLVLSS